MIESLEKASTSSNSEIRIERLNTDKTRKDLGSDKVYHIYFELSGNPPAEWRSIFGREWKLLNPAQEAAIEGAFLIIHCQLHDVALAQFPALKKAVAATNEAYRKYAQTEAKDIGLREDAWAQERKDVDDMATSLRFE